MDNNQNQDPNNINIELNEVVAAGVYVNLALVNHSPSEFVLDFIQLMPGVQQAKVRSRVIVAPLHAKRVLAALQQNVANYEQQFGEIKEVEPFVLGGNNVQA
ncbi:MULTISPECIES: DUF3467 domain-containing protein [Epilithonimonas]|jgi:hypothetical protein|uniref:Uncharacterized protein DUF3467 n=4 Tax=Epilithonimonas TaxID=2782229 RepID=A0A420D9K0_9FLAO|nr:MULTISPECIES: DUF3467 domain-containing protein [Epilithonimonas]MPS72228.1 DUF3467 domain-containing protein [Chryseobacterium sp.]MDP9954481.1 hypothetical protein [Epilithonimonas hungarica]MPT30300.1 DUF3467 domain-containing protein [Chryseobacterium sp.]PZU84607.1 MAG: DUF3467 domain-containing protein [Chryseobacterium sp.]REC72916.1 DUF3467 domain-containing protein [Epilithonimonas hispanica]